MTSGPRVIRGVRVVQHFLAHRAAVRRTRFLHVAIDAAMPARRHRQGECDDVADAPPALEREPFAGRDALSTGSPSTCTRAPSAHAGTRTRSVKRVACAGATRSWIAPENG